MKKKNDALLVALLVLSANCNCTAGEDWKKCPVDKPPQFSDYSIPVIGHAFKIDKLKLRTARSRKYRTVITDQSKLEVNFAGFYRVATWGCGTDCHQFAIVNKKNGLVYTHPTINLVAGVNGNDEPRIDSRSDSELFIISGNFNDIENTEGKYYFQWSGKKLIPVCKMELKKVFSE